MLKVSFIFLLIMINQNFDSLFSKISLFISRQCNTVSRIPHTLSEFFAKTILHTHTHIQETLCAIQMVLTQKQIHHHQHSKPTHPYEQTHQLRTLEIPCLLMLHQLGAARL